MPEGHFESRANVESETNTQAKNHNQQTQGVVQVDEMETAPEKNSEIENESRIDIGFEGAGEDAEEEHEENVEESHDDEEEETNQCSNNGCSRDSTGRICRFCSGFSVYLSLT